MSAVETIICSDEDGEFYALNGDLTRQEAIDALATIDVHISGECEVNEDGETIDGDGYPLELARGHIVSLTGDELIAELGPDPEYDQYWVDCSADRPGAREVWIARIS